MVRFAVPFDARREVCRPADPEGLRAQLTRMGEDGIEYAIVPAPDDALRPDGFRLVTHEPGVCVIFALESMAELRSGPAADGLPFPPPEMVRLVAGIATPHRFYQRFIEGGASVAGRISDLLARNGLALDRCGSVYDFGCGCGRVMRRWKDLCGTRLHGSDYNPLMIEWCRRNLPFAEFSVNDLEPGLDLPDGDFGLVYSYSVFTHLPLATQRPWLEELVRVTAPGGHLVLTFHGEQTLDDLDDAGRSRFAAGELVVVARDEGEHGTNACAAYHPESWIRGTLAPDLDILDAWPGDSSFKQDAFLIRKPLQARLVDHG